MVLELKFDSISELAELQRLAVQADKPVYIANEDDSIRVSAKLPCSSRARARH